MNAADLLRRELGAVGFAGDVLGDLANYPAQQPTTYRRTGTLGRGWRIRGPSGSGRIIVEVSNRTPYAVHVQGPTRGAKGERQTAVMRSKNWPAITTVARNRWRQRRAAIVRILNHQDKRLHFPAPN